MNFLFGFKPKHNSSNLPTSLPEDSIVLSIDPSLFKSAKQPRLNTIDLKTLSTNSVLKKVYASSLETSSLVYQSYPLKNKFLASADVAFDSHLGFVLSPSQLFLLILQQVALHTNKHSEELRDQFVRHDGKIELSLEIPATPTKEEWEGAIGNFRAQIGANALPDVLELLSMDGFQCANLSEKIAGEVTLMDICQQYFEYKVYTSCGIPYFILEGSISDWELLRQKAEEVIMRKTLPSLRDYWLPALLPVLDKLLRARKSEELDRGFFEDFYKRGSKDGSGGYTFVNGWINVFFPVTTEKKRNQFCLPYRSSFIFKPTTNDGLDVRDFTTGIAFAPVSWTRLEEKVSMEFYAGFVGGHIVHQNCIRPEVAWWVGSIDEEATRRKFSRYL